MCLSIAIHRPEDILEKGEELGLEWMIIHNGNGYRCGYVRIPFGHVWHGKSYHDLNVDCHGGLTFAEADVPCNAPGPDTDWWIGFDCAHGHDAPDPELPNKRGFRDPLSTLITDWFDKFNFDRQVRTQEYVRDQVMKICEQAFQAVPSFEND